MAISSRRSAVRAAILLERLRPSGRIGIRSSTVVRLACRCHATRPRQRAAGGDLAADRPPPGPNDKWQAEVLRAIAALPRHACGRRINSSRDDLTGRCSTRLRRNVAGDTAGVTFALATLGSGIVWESCDHLRKVIEKTPRRAFAASATAPLIS